MPGDNYWAQQEQSGSPPDPSSNNFWAQKESQAKDPPVSTSVDSRSTLQKNIDVAKAAPRELMEGAGDFADFWSDIAKRSVTEGGLPGALAYKAHDIVASMFGQPKAQIDPDHPLVHALAKEIADRAGLPQTGNTPAERIIGAGVRALPAAVAAGPEAASAAIPTALSGVASQAVKEAGAGPIAQTLAGLLPLSPAGAAASIRGAVRGGAEGAAELAQNIKTAQGAGLNLSAGQLTDNSVLKAGEAISNKIPVGNKRIAATRGEGLNSQVEDSVSDIVKKLSPTFVQKPPTPVNAGETISAGVNKTVEGLNQETTEAKNAMHEAVGGKDTPMAAPTLDSTLAKVTGSTGVEQIDSLVTGAKTKAVAKAAKSVSETPHVPISYSTDQQGFHSVSSPNGETHAVETAAGDIKVTRSDTAEGARGNGEGTSRLETLATVATNQGKKLVSDVSVSPSEAKAYEKLSNRGWTVEKNPNAEVNPETGNTISDSPKNPVYTVTAPKTTTTPGKATQPATGEGTDFAYDTKTGESTPGQVQNPTEGSTPAQTKPVLNQPTPWTFDSLRQLRTLVGRGIRSTRDPGQQGQLKQLYGAISDDLTAGVNKISPEAGQAYDFFNSVAKQNAATQKVLTRAISKLGGPEQVFKTAVSGTADGASKISPIMAALDTEGRNTLRATVLHRMGRTGGAIDAPFDANTFLRNWRNMSPEAKNVMFGKGGPGSSQQLRNSLDSLNDSLDRLTAQGYIKSGFVKGVSQGVQHGTSVIKHAGLTGVLVLLGDHLTGIAGHVLEGHPFTAAGAAATGLGALAINPVMSRVLTNPKTAAWLAQATKAPRSSLPILMTQLNRMGTTDPDAKDLSTLLQQASASQGTK